MNKNEAEKYLKLANEAIKADDLEKALYLLEKAKAIQNTDQVSKLIKKTKEAIKQKKQIPDFSPEQEALSKQIIGKTDYYDILNLPKSATQEDIKRSYRKIVLKFHPDKNKAPSASDAFRTIQKAYECLSDENRKAHYDDTGQDQETNFNMEHLFTKETLLIFIAEFSQDSVFSPVHNIHRWYSAEQAAFAQKFDWKLRSTPIFFFIIFAILALLDTATEDFSLSFSPKFSELRTTMNYQLPYYVKKDFEGHFEGENLKEIEDIVEQVLLTGLNKECERQKRKKQQVLAKIRQAEGNNAKVLESYAESLDFSACKRMEQLVNR